MKYFSVYLGRNCEINTKDPKCIVTSPVTSLRVRPCGSKGKCQIKPDNNGIFCDCDEDTDGPFCTLSARHFPEDSHLVMKGMPLFV